MTRHEAVVQVGEQQVEVLVCFERGMQGFSLDTRVGEVVLYDSDSDARLFLPGRFEQAYPVGCMEWEELNAKLAEMCIELPTGMSEALQQDAQVQAAPYARVWA